MNFLGNKTIEKFHAKITSDDFIDLNSVGTNLWVQKLVCFFVYMKFIFVKSDVTSDMFARNIYHTYMCYVMFFLFSAQCECFWRSTSDFSHYGAMCRYITLCFVGFVTQKDGCLFSKEKNGGIVISVPSVLLLASLSVCKSFNVITEKQLAVILSSLYSLISANVLFLLCLLNSVTKLLKCHHLMMF